MLSTKQERTFGNGRLRDQWEKRAQSEADQCKQQTEWKKKSSLKLLFSKWNYHLSTYTNGDQMSDFRRVTSGEDDADNNKPYIKFKIGPPPPKPKPEPPPSPPPPRRRSSPRRHRQKRKVEVDVFQLCWKDSWMSLKPPKYLFLKAKELRARILEFTSIDVTNNRMYKPTLERSEEEVTPAAEDWRHSWKQVKSPAQAEFSELKQKFEWEILFEREFLCEPEVEEYILPRWAGTWKVMNFVFRQQKHSWDRVWPEFPQSLSDKTERLQELEEQDQLSDWDESWKLSGAESQPKRDDETLTPPSWSSISSVKTSIVDFYQPGWSSSWLLSAAPPEEEEERQKSWTSCWRFRQQIRWRCASLQSHHQHSDAMMKRRQTLNVLLSSPLDNDMMDRAEWTKSWKTPKGWIQPEEDEEVEVKKEDEEEEEDEREDQEMEEEEDEKKDEEEEEENKDEDEVEEDKKEDEEMEEEEDEKKDEEEEEENKDEDEVEEDEGVEIDEEGEYKEEEEEAEEETDKEEEDEEDNSGADGEKDEEIGKEQERKIKREEGEEDEQDKEDDVRNEDDAEDEDVDEEEEEDTEEEEGHTEMKTFDGEEHNDEEHEEEEDIKEKSEEDEVNGNEEEEDEEEDTEEERTDEEEDTEEERTDDGVMVDTEDNKHEKMEEKKVEEAEEEEKSSRKHKPDVPLHLQFHKLHTSFSSWSRSWMVAVAHRGDQSAGEDEDEDGDESWRAWKESWKLCQWKKPDEDEVTCFSTEHLSHRRAGVMREEDGAAASEWALSWRTNNAWKTEEEEEEEEEDGDDEEEQDEEEEER